MFRRSLNLARVSRIDYLLRRRSLSNLTKETTQVLIHEPFDATGVLRLTLNRPDKRNALSLEVLNELSSALQELKSGKYQNIRCVVLASTGTVFSSGHDLKELLKFSDRKGFEECFSLCSQVMQKIQEVPQPVIAAVNGIATAAGCQLVATCDLAVASPKSKFATPGVKIGLFCSTPAVAISRVIGRKAAMDMLLTARSVPAQEAKQIGLISHVCDDPDTFALELAKDVADASAVALRIGKHAFYSQIQAEQLDNAYASATNAMVEGMIRKDAREGITAFLEKRQPKWVHE